MGAEVILLHVPLDLTIYSLTYMNMGPLQLDSVEEINDASKKFLEKTKKHLGDETIQTLLKQGEFADTIIKTAEEIHADIIVLGSHSRRWMENILMGSVTEKVLHQTSIPLFIVPTKKNK
jgi:nucleotide-binding universal stress UspA family protein